MNSTELQKNFEMFEDDDDKIAYLLELGKNLPPYPTDKKTSEYKIYGCSSNVWIYTEKINDKYQFYFDSDALIVKGLLFIIYTLVNGKTLSEIRSLSLGKLFEEIGLKPLLSNQRQVGLSAIISQIENLN